MARKRQLQNIQLGDHIASVLWLEKCGHIYRERAAGSVPVRVEEKWMYIYLRDGEEVVKLSRTRNLSAQVYVCMNLEAVMREKVINGVEGSSQCCWGKFGWVRACNGEDALWEKRNKRCKVHTDKWLKEQIAEKLDAIMSDEEWATSVAVQQKKAAGRVEAIASGFAEWRRHGKEWCIYAEDYKPGAVVQVRRRSGTVSSHRLGEQVAEDLYMLGEEVPQQEAA